MICLNLLRKQGTAIVLAGLRWFLFYFQPGILETESSQFLL